MAFTLVAVAVALGLSLLLGGRPRYLAERSFRWWALLPAGLGLQLVIEADGFPAAFAGLLLSYALLVGFTLVNLRVVGMWLITLGFAMNALAIGVNHGMPVSRSALRALDAEAPAGEVKHHARRPSDRLMVLADVIPVPPLREVLSFGDMVLGVGVADVLFNLMRPPRRRGQASPAATATGSDDTEAIASSTSVELSVSR